MGDGPTRGSDEPRPHARRGLDDTVPASEPPTDIDGNPMRVSRASIPPQPTQRYRLGAELGRGGMGRVVEAFDTQLGRTVALKEVLPKGADNVARRFLREIEITARLEHASIVPLYDSGTTVDGRPFYVMRRVSGRPLDELLNRARGLGERLTLLPAMLAAIDAVAHAHRRGVIHRDLKPTNILVGDLGETVVIDWGLAKVIGEEDEASVNSKVPMASDSLQTQMGSVFGTPGFMAPEQARGEELGTQGDVYALGATLYHLLAGTPPHVGTSATEVLGRTLVHDVPPLADTAPGAPPELVAIVDKALAFEQGKRYADAGALGEDVRRFLTGQLVAAHRYTPRQRASRFARKHRTALAVAALATVAVAALAWFSVHRIVQERDAATDARRAAIAEKRDAELARDRLAERNDALLVTQARALIETNPTDALAVLKQLSPSSARLPEARAVAQAAVARGVWWAIQTADQLTVRVELSVDGKQLLQITRDGLVRVWDLERRRLVIARPYPTIVSAVWLGDAVLVFGDATAPELLDPAANRSEPLAVPRATWVEADGTGARAILLGKDHTAHLFDRATRVSRPLWAGHEIHDAVIADDGSWYALGDRKEVVVFDRDDKELLRQVGPSVRLKAGMGRRLAIADQHRVIDCTFAATAVCTPVPMTILPQPLVIDTSYRGEILDILVATGDVIAWNGTSTVTRAHLERISMGMAPCWSDLTVVPGDGELHLLSSWLRSRLALPTNLAHMRLATRRGISRVVVVGDGVILGLDLEAHIPRPIRAPIGTESAFVTDDKLLTWRNGGMEWAWIDLPSGKMRSFEHEVRGLVRVEEVDHLTQRVLLTEELQKTTRLVVMRDGMAPRVLASGARAWGRLITGDAFVYAPRATTPDGRIFGGIGEGEARELVTLDGDALAAVSIGIHQFAAISDRGEVVRGDLRTGAIQRTTVTPGKGAFVASDLAGQVMIIVDNRLMLWRRQDVVELQRFDKPILSVSSIVSGQALVTLADRDVIAVTLEPNAVTHRVFTPSQQTPLVSADGRTAISLGNQRQLQVVELPSLMRWNLPVLFDTMPAAAISPSSRRVAQAGFGMLVLWSLPTTSADFAAWLDEQTNAVRSDDILVWPWQVRTRP